MANDRTILIFTVALTALMAAVSYANSRDWALVLFIIPLVASATYWSMLFSRRLTRRLAPPPSPSGRAAEAAPRPEPTTERPEHAQRRRSRRRQRGRRGPGSNSG